MPDATTYQAIRQSFSWDVPQTYNIGVDVTERWANTDRIALRVWEEDGQKQDISFHDLNARANKLAHGLRGLGLAREDRVGLLLPQCPETALTHIATYKCAAIAVPLASLFGIDALLYRLQNSGTRFLVTNTEGAEKVSQIREKLPQLELVIVVGDAALPKDAISFEALIKEQSAQFQAQITSPDDPAVMVYTSGTTGPPKGALHGHRVLLGHLPGVSFTHDSFPQNEDVMWTPADWAWAGGLFNVLLPALHFGITVVVHDFRKFDPDTAFRLIQDCNVRNCFIPPTALKMMRAVKTPAETYDLNLRTIASGGESLGGEVYDWGQAELGLTINEFYGQTEANIVIGSSVATGVSKRGAIGKAVPGHTVAIIDDAGNELPPGTPGQIAILHPDPVMFLSYWQQEEATQDKFIGDWMTTGDQGVADEDGYISFVGRDDDVITSAGFRIGPGEIEDCLIGHPAVSLAAAIGKPDPLRTEIVKAFIVLAQGHTASAELEADIQDYVKTRLSAHEYPREIEFIDELPLTTTGKVIRRLLRDSG